MKKAIFTVLFFLVLNAVYGQTQSENTWILGRWVGMDSFMRGVEIVFNDNGTGRWNTDDIIFSINGNLLRIFSATGLISTSGWNVWIINDQRMVLENTRDLNFVINLNRIN